MPALCHLNPPPLITIETPNYYSIKMPFIIIALIIQKCVVPMPSTLIYYMFWYSTLPQRQIIEGHDVWCINDVVKS